MGNNFMDAPSGEVMLVQNLSPISLKASFERKSSPWTSNVFPLRIFLILGFVFLAVKQEGIKNGFSS